MKLCEYANNLFGIFFLNKTIIGKEKIFFEKRHENFQELFYLSSTVAMVFPRKYRKRKSYTRISIYMDSFIIININGSIIIRKWEKSPDIKIIWQW
ncbi:MAG: hypothetical protein ACPL1B_09695 [Thermoprotei archaeon]